MVASAKSYVMKPYLLTEILRANPGRTMLIEAGIMRNACLYGSNLGLYSAQVMTMGS